MKKAVRMTLVLLVLIGSGTMFHMDAVAADTVQEVIQYEDGTYAEITTEQFSTARAAKQITGSKTYTYKTLTGATIFTYTLTGTFRYTGNTATALTCSTKYSVKKDGWHRVSDTPSCSGNKAYGTSKFSNGTKSKTVSLTLTCSGAGKIS